MSQKEVRSLQPFAALSPSLLPKGRGTCPCSLDAHPPLVVAQLSKLCLVVSDQELGQSRETRARVRAHTRNVHSAQKSWVYSELEFCWTRCSQPMMLPPPAAFLTPTLSGSGLSLLGSPLAFHLQFPSGTWGLVRGVGKKS